MTRIISKISKTIIPIVEISVKIKSLCSFLLLKKLLKSFPNVEFYKRSFSRNIFEVRTPTRHIIITKFVVTYI